MKFQSIKTSELKPEQISQILRLKESNWIFGIQSQENWFKQNAFPDDVHNLMLVNKEIKGYTFLGNRSLEISIDSIKTKKSNYFLFSTLILDKKYRHFINLSKLMKLNNKIIKKFKKPSFLLCKKEKANMYRYFGWRKLENTSFSVPDHKNDLIGFVFNINDIKFNKEKKIRFFCYK